MSREIHDSYGLARLSRLPLRPSRQGRLFGSKIATHSHIFELTIHSASVREEDIITDEKPIVRVLLTPAQLASLITLTQKPGGTPCTIVSKEGRRVDLPKRHKDTTTAIEEAAAEIAEQSEDCKPALNKLKEKCIQLLEETIEELEPSTSCRR